MIELTFSVTPDRDLKKALEALRGAGALRLSRAAVSAAAKALVPMIRGSITPGIFQQTDMLRKSIGYRTKKSRKGFGYYAMIGPRRSLSTFRDASGQKQTKTASWRRTTDRKFPKLREVRPTRYAHLKEKGHQRGAGRSSAAGYPFMGPAAARARGAMLGVAAAAARQELPGAVQTTSLGDVAEGGTS